MAISAALAEGSQKSRQLLFEGEEMEFQTKYPGPWADTQKDGLLTHNVGEWKVRSPEVEKSKCTRCGQCYLYCPTGCIEDKDTHFEANMLFCKGCGVCAKVCVTQAIKMTTGGK
jgi:pyruvate ferredoxin oxidoreductase delta subunit